jgi:hypothetical protein
MTDKRAEGEERCGWVLCSGDAVETLVFLNPNCGGMGRLSLCAGCMVTWLYEQVMI